MIEALKVLASCLPRVAEEGTDAEAVIEGDLAKRVAAATGDLAQGQVVVSMVRSALVLASCLDERELTQRRWKFVSFPAALFARSLLMGAGQEGFRLLDPGFWEVSDPNIDRQRTRLRELEQRRMHSGGSARPIRRVWVAWVLIAVDGNFLLVQREDPTPDRPDSQGEFVLPGGRVSSADLANIEVSERLDFFDPNLPLPKGRACEEALERAARRELLEELELGVGDIATLDRVGEVFPHCALEGARSAHALTEYLLQLHRIELTSAGRFTLLRALASHSHRYAWFTTDELRGRRNRRGEKAFVDALLWFPASQLESLLEAARYEIPIGDVPAGREEVDIPLAPDVALAIGPTGKERRHLVRLTDADLKMLGFLAAVRRGDAVKRLAPGLRFAPRVGWLIVENSELLHELTRIAAQLRSLDSSWVPLAIEGAAIRLNLVDPSLVGFDASAFSLRVAIQDSGERYLLRLTRCAIECPLGVAIAHTQTLQTAATLGEAVFSLATQGKSTEVPESVKRHQREPKEKAFLTSAGLRLLIRWVNKEPELVVRDAGKCDASH
jgi:8-oxo-dGTP pyrophosphatase MutT (NUDIX family)